MKSFLQAIKYCKSIYKIDLFISINFIKTTHARKFSDSTVQGWPAGTVVGIISVCSFVYKFRVWVRVSSHD